MDNSKLSELIRSFDTEIEIKEGKQYLEISVPASNLFRIASLLKENEDTFFDFLFCLSGVDYGNDLGVVYHIRSTKYNHSVVIKTRISDRKNPVIDSVTDIWKAAEFHEREVFDLLGIKFKNHPDLRRFFLSKSWGYPLRKDYVDDINIVTKS
jgi:NADH:ubiquinone oxidoreductase subunit C